MTYFVGKTSCHTLFNCFINIDILNMMKQSIASIALTAMAFALSAAPITPQQALTRMKGYSHKSASRSVAAASLKLAHTTLTESGSPAAYIFNRTTEPGYIVLSGDDRAFPVLGYSDNGKADEGNLPPQLEWWLSEYARQIEFADAHGYNGSRKSVPMRADMTAIKPMVTAKWNQGAPYNDQCPLYGNERTYTGCVATAMAQVMNYWKYPVKGQGKISYECSGISKKLSMDFSEKEFDWDNILDNYIPGQYNEKQAEAVAYLMKAAGYSVRMSYGTDSSGALAMNIANGLSRYLGYDGNIEYTMRGYYSTTQWAELLYDNLKNVGPIVYGGGSTLGGGHSFVCDGYDGEGMFHFNWGWSGMSDGYFSLDALNPESLGTGGGSGGGYNFTQDAVLGIQPPTGKPVEERPLRLDQVGSLAGYMEGDVLHFDLFGCASAMWVNYNVKSMKVKFGAMFEKMGDDKAEPVYSDVSSRQYDIKQGYGANIQILQPQVDLSQLNLQDGTYRVTMCTRLLDDEEAAWQPVKANYGYFNNIILHKNGSNYSVDVEMIGTIEILDAEILNTLYDGGLAKVRLKLRNNEDYEISQGFAPAFFYHQGDQDYVSFLGESVLVTMSPHSEIVKEWTTSVYALQGAPNILEPTALMFTLYDEMTNGFNMEECWKDITMQPSPGKPGITTTAPEIVGAEKKSVVANGQKLDLYVVKDPSDMEVKATLTLQEGVMIYDAMAAVLIPSEANPGYMEVYDYTGYPVLMETPGETHEFSSRLSMPDMQPETIYYLVMTYGYNNSLETMGGSHTSFFTLDTSAVEQIENSAPAMRYDGTAVYCDGEIAVYTLQGILAASGNGRVAVDALVPGIYLARCGNAVLKFIVR